jgi:hypothetical protein
MLGTPLTSTEGVVALFASAGEHVEQAGRGIIDNTVDDRSRDWGGS